MDMFKFVLKSKLKKITGKYLKSEMQEGELCLNYEKAYKETLQLITEYDKKCHTQKVQ